MLSPAAIAKTASAPNVLFLVVDDLGDEVGFLGAPPGVKTPNLDRLARRSLVFERAFTPAPLCNPSRTAVITGMRPERTGIYSNRDRWRLSEAAQSSVTLFQTFRDNGYSTAWSGKVYHDRPGDPELEHIWNDRRGADGDYGPYPTRRTIPAELSTHDAVRGCYDVEAWTGPDTDFSDVVNTDLTIRRLQAKHDKPFFIALGFYRPHCPWTAPKRFFDLYTGNDLPLRVPVGDEPRTLPALGQRTARGMTSDERLRAQGWDREIVRGYLASVSFMDWNLGRVLDALDASPEAANTIVVLWSDHGFDLGHKHHWGKNALWEHTTRVPFLIAVPGKTHGQRTAAPVGLVDLYPTLLDLAGLPPPSSPLDGVSLRPLLENPAAEWDRPVLMSKGGKSFAVRTRHWRYIRYKDGTEELYDHTVDPSESRNLATDSANRKTMDELARTIPTSSISPARPPK